MTKIEIIKETIAFYSEDPNRRALDERGLCVYNAPNGNHCAVGRCMLLEYREKGQALDIDVSVSAIQLAKELNKKVLDDVLEERYRGHSDTFWSNLQNFHDQRLNWDSEGLTTFGENSAKILLERDS